MEIVDLQWHEPAPFEDWSGEPGDVQDRAMAEALWQYIDAVGVHAVVMAALSREDWISSMARRYPDLIATVVELPVHDVSHYERWDDARARDEVSALIERVGAVALRVGAIAHLKPDLYALYDDGGFDSVFAACQTLGVPIWLKMMGGLTSVPRIARRFPDLQIIVDHMGLMQPPFQARQEPPWKELPLTLALSEFSNVSIKVAAPLTLTDETYPWSDTRQHIHELVSAFGSERLAWASDINRVRGRIGFSSRLRAAATSKSPADNQRGPDAHIPGPPPGEADYPGKHTYMESLALILYDEQISLADKQNMLGGTTRRLLRWPRPDSEPVTPDRF